MSSSILFYKSFWNIVKEGNTKKQYNFVKTTLDLVPLLQQLQTHLLLNLLPKFYIWKKLFLYVAFSRNFFISFLSKKYSRPIRRRRFIHRSIWNITTKTTRTITSATNATARAWYQTRRNLCLKLSLETSLYINDDYIYKNFFNCDILYNMMCFKLCCHLFL